MAETTDLAVEFREATLHASENELRGEVRVTKQKSNGDPVELSAWRAFRSPLGIEHLHELRWYLERYFLWPYGGFRDEARRIEARLPDWGRGLFEQVFAPLPNAGELLAAPGTRVTISAPVEGATATPEQVPVMALPWELMGETVPALGNVPFVRRVRSVHSPADSSQPTGRASDAAAERLRVLLIVSRPEEAGLSILDPRPCFFALVERLAGFRQRIEVNVLESGSFEALTRELERAAATGTRYQVVHFDGHGLYDLSLGGGCLCFEEDFDRKDRLTRGLNLVNADVFARLVGAHSVPLVILDACQTAHAGASPSSVAGAVLASGIESVVATTYTVLDDSARRFSEALYVALASGQTISEATANAQAHLRDSTCGSFALRDWFVPVLYQRSGADRRLIEARASELTATRSVPTSTGAPLIGRAAELLQLQRAVAGFHTVFIWGRIGEGMTTLADMYARWQQAVGRFEMVLRVDLHRAMDEQSALVQLAALLDLDEALAQKAFDEGQAGARLQARLEGRSTLIVLDGVEFHPEDSRTSKYPLALANQLVSVPNVKVLVTTSTLPARGVPNGAIVTMGPLGPLDAKALVRNVIGTHPSIPDLVENDLDWAIHVLGGHCRSLVHLGKALQNGGTLVGKSPREILEQVAPAEESELAYLRRRASMLPPDAAPAKTVAVAVGPQWVQQMEHLASAPSAQEAARLCGELMRFGLAIFHEGYLFPHPALGPSLRRELDDPVAKERLSCGGTLGILRQLLRKTHDGTSLDMPGGFERLIPGLVDSLHLIEAWVARGDAPSADDVMPWAMLALVLAQQRGVGARQLDVAIERLSRLCVGAYAAALTEAKRARELEIRGDYAEALAGFARLRATIQETDDTNIREMLPGVLAMECDLLRRLGRPREAAERHREATEAMTAVPTAGPLNEGTRFDLCILEGDNQRNQRNFDEAEAAYRRGLEIVQQNRDRRNLAVFHGRLGALRFYQSRDQEAVAEHEAALAILEDCGDPCAAATARMQLAASLIALGRSNEAEGLLVEALAVAEQLKALELKASTLNQLAVLYYNQGRVELAERYFEDALGACGGDSAMHAGIEEARRAFRAAVRAVPRG